MKKKYVKLKKKTQKNSKLKKNKQTKTETQIKKENGSAKQNGSKQEKREGPELQDWVPQKPPCFAGVAEQTLVLQMQNTAQSVENNVSQTNQPSAKLD